LAGAAVVFVLVFVVLQLQDSLPAVLRIGDGHSTLLDDVGNSTLGVSAGLSTLKNCP
jgi:hypothetical protein